jgi:hypothetical protein
MEADGWRRTGDAVTRENTVRVPSAPSVGGAPQRQPEVTGHETHQVHNFTMRRWEQKKQGGSSATAEALPELKPWREVGWIFRDGGCIAIERHGEETRARVLAD